MEWTTARPRNTMAARAHKFKGDRAGTAFLHDDYDGGVADGQGRERAPGQQHFCQLAKRISFLFSL